MSADEPDDRPQGDAEAGAPSPRADASELTSPTAWEAVRARWVVLSSTQRLRAKQLGVGAAIGMLGYGLYSASG
jgi:conjugal transfer pilus assembly protein TraB